MSGLLRSNFTVATGTAVSRVTGMLRTFVLAAVLGKEALADAYVVANETPNIVYDLLLGGVLSATLVPLFTSYLEPGRTDGGDELGAAADERRRATNVIITTAVALLTVLTIVAVVAAPLIFRLYSLDGSDTIDIDLYRNVGTTLTRIFLLQIFFYGLAGLANAYLNSRKRFFAAAWSPVVPNLIIVATLLSLPDPGDAGWQLADVVTDARLRWTLGLGATAGIAAMAFIVVPATVGAGLRFRPVLDFKHPAVRKLLTLSGWTVGFVAANQVAVVVVRNLVLTLGIGSQSAYTFAFVFFVLPHGLLAVSVATTFQPELARSVSDRDPHRFHRQTSLGIRSILALTVPAAAALVALAEPVVGTMQRGEFDAADVSTTASALRGLAIGLPAFSVYLFTLRGFYANQDTRTPFILNIGQNALNIVLAVSFMQWWSLFGIGFAYAVAYVLAAWWAVSVLRNKTRLPLRPILSSLWRLALAGVLMGEAIWFVTHDVADDAGWRGLAQLTVGGLVGVVVYGAVLFLLRSPELDGLRTVIGRLTNKADSGSAPEPPRSSSNHHA